MARRGSGSDDVHSPAGGAVHNGSSSAVRTAVHNGDRVDAMLGTLASVAQYAYPLSTATHVPMDVANQLRRAVEEITQAQRRLETITQTLAAVYGLEPTSKINFDTGEIER